MSELNGEIIQVIGPVVDVNFANINESSLPKIHDALAIQQETQAEEIESHINNDTPNVSAEDADTDLVVPTRGDD